MKKYQIALRIIARLLRIFSIIFITIVILSWAIPFLKTGQIPIITARDTTPFFLWILIGVLASEYINKFQEK